MDTRVEFEMGYALHQLKLFFIQERLDYQSYAKRAKFDRNARVARAMSHQVLANLVPKHRAAEKLLMQPKAGRGYQAATRSLATTLVSRFISKSHIPDEHPLWSIRISAQHLRYLVERGPIPDTNWYARYEELFPGITQALNSNAQNLGEIRRAYLDYASTPEGKERAELRRIMSRIKVLFPEKDYELLSASLSVKL